MVEFRFTQSWKFLPSCSKHRASGWGLSGSCKIISQPATSTELVECVFTAIALEGDLTFYEPCQDSLIYIAWNHKFLSPNNLKVPCGVEAILHVMEQHFYEWFIQPIMLRNIAVHQQELRRSLVCTHEFKLCRFFKLPKHGFSMSYEAGNAFNAFFWLLTLNVNWNFVLKKILCTCKYVPKYENCNYLNDMDVFQSHIILLLFT